MPRAIGKTRSRARATREFLLSVPPGLREGDLSPDTRPPVPLRFFLPRNARAGARFYLATDETDSTSLAYFRSRGAVLLSDLLTPADSALLSWPGHYADVLAVVEQQVLARAAYLVGSELSSTTGGAVNLRTRLGFPQWSWSVLLRGTELGARQDDLRRRRGARARAGASSDAIP